MPKTLDLLIGLSLVMLIVSMAVTVITQFAVNVFNSRGRNLKKGLADLLLQIDPTLPLKTSEAIVIKVLTHPLICQKGGRMGTVVHREEFTQLLLELAAGDGPQKLDDMAKDTLSGILRANGISDPGVALKNIRRVALQLEVSHPEMASNVRKNTAILQEVTSDFVAKIHSWFDQTIDRISDRFATSTRVLTFMAALFVAVVLQLDTVGLINRLSTNDQLRNSFVQQAMQIEKDSSVTNQSGGEYYRKYDRLLASGGLISMPQDGSDWKNQWRWMKLPGILLSAMLLSLGAPFWYNTLKNLLQLRSLIAGKDDDQRQTRQSSQDSAGTSAGS
ncbi:MAG TPA: hypothetical protein VMX16_03980 [Terriglobia bacterium]|nr:hypothetical protein [Terriglobia bacterium]